jgi:transposase
LLERRLELIERAVALTEEVSILESLTVRVQLICGQLQILGKAVEKFNERIEELFKEHPDREIFASLPGAGPTLAPRLLASLGSQRERFERASHLQRYSGIAPVTKQSGGKRHVHRRYQCPKFCKQSFHEYAKESIRWCRWAAAFYMVMRQRGCNHHTAVRALAYKWQRIIWRCWQDRVAYRDEVYEAILKKKGSPVLEYLDRIVLGKSPMKTLLEKSK